MARARTGGELHAAESDVIVKTAADVVLATVRVFVEG